MQSLKGLQGSTSFWSTDLVLSDAENIFKRMKGSNAIIVDFAALLHIWLWTVSICTLD